MADEKKPTHTIIPVDATMELSDHLLAASKIMGGKVMVISLKENAQHCVGFMLVPRDVPLSWLWDNTMIADMFEPAVYIPPDPKEFDA